jgi:hypothetical protein
MTPIDPIDVGRNAVGRNPRRAMTLVELLMATALNSIIILSVFFLWKAINVHVIETRRKEIFNAETQRIALEVLSLLQHSPRIITFDNSGISFISHRSGDTSRIDNYYGQLRLDQTPFPSAISGLKTAGFSIDDQHILPNDGMSIAPALLRVGLRFRDPFADSSAYTLDVAVSLAPRRPEAEGDPLDGL